MRNFIRFTETGSFLECCPGTLNEKLEKYKSRYTCLAIIPIIWMLVILLWKASRFAMMKDQLGKDPLGDKPLICNTILLISLNLSAVRSLECITLLIGLFVVFTRCSTRIYKGIAGACILSLIWRDIICFFLRDETQELLSSCLNNTFHKESMLHQLTIDNLIDVGTIICALSFRKYAAKIENIQKVLESLD